MAEETVRERRRRYRQAWKKRDPEGWKRYRREMKRRMRERRRDPNRLRHGEWAAMSPDERREHSRRKRLQAKYSLTQEQFDAMVVEQPN